jgi:hypothetical protein
VLTLVFTFGALWIAFVLTGDEPPDSAWRPLRWFSSLGATFYDRSFSQLFYL